MRVELSDKSFRIGWIYTKDPETGSVVLLDTALSRVVLVFGQNVTGVCALSSEEKERMQARAALDKLSERRPESHEQTKAFETQRALVLEWLERHRIPVCTEGYLLRITAGNVVIDPPYNAESCRGTNPIVLDRIQKLIRSMPAA